MKRIRKSVIFAYAAVVYFTASPLPKAFGVTPAPDGGYGNNTAEGNGALGSLTTGSDNTAIGASALFNNTTGGGNTASGAGALQNNTGDDNTANGLFALFNNTTAQGNTATGSEALIGNRTGGLNTATGFGALGHNITGYENTATGFGALVRSTGSNNIALGANAGIHLTTGSYNIDIGNNGVDGESASIRIGDQNQTATYIAGIYGTSTDSTFVPVVINAAGQLGVGHDAGVPKGTIITVAPGSPAPNGYTFLGTQSDKIEYKDPEGHEVKIKGAKLYQKN
jgi:hypothetical protein